MQGQYPGLCVCVCVCACVFFFFSSVCMCMCVCARAWWQRGTVTVHGQSGLTMRELRKVTALVPHDDALLPEMTVGEAVTLSARMRLPVEMSSSQVRRFVDKVRDHACELVRSAFLRGWFAFATNFRRQ
jgi:hypothetical protein